MLKVDYNRISKVYDKVREEEIEELHSLLQGCRCSVCLTAACLQSMTVNFAH